MLGLSQVGVNEDFLRARRLLAPGGTARGQDRGRLPRHPAASHPVRGTHRGSPGSADRCSVDGGCMKLLLFLVRRSWWLAMGALVAGAVSGLCAAALIALINKALHQRSRRSVRHTRPFMAMFAASGRTREGSCYSSEARRSGGPSTGGSSTGRTLRRAGSRSGQASTAAPTPR